MPRLYGTVSNLPFWLHTNILEYCETGQPSKGIKVHFGSCLLLLSRRMAILWLATFDLRRRRGWLFSPISSKKKREEAEQGTPALPEAQHASMYTYMLDDKRLQLIVRMVKKQQNFCNFPHNCLASFALIATTTSRRLIVSPTNIFLTLKLSLSEKLDKSFFFVNSRKLSNKVYCENVKT